MGGGCLYLINNELTWPCQRRRKHYYCGNSNGWDLLSGKALVLFSREIWVRMKGEIWRRMATNTWTHGVPPLISGTGYSTDLKYKVMPTKQTPPKNVFEKNRNRISLFQPGPEDVQINWCLVGSKKPSPSGSAAFSISKAIEQRNAGYWRRG